jgi:TolB-like protein
MTLRRHARILGFLGVLACLGGAGGAKSTRVAVLPFEVVGLPASLADDLAEASAAELSRVPSLTTMSRGDIAAALGFHAQRLMAGCQGDAPCVADVASVLDADKLVSGRVSKIGDRTVVAVKLIDVKRMEVERRATDEVIGGPELLPGVVRRLSGLLVATTRPEGEARLPEVDIPLKETRDDPAIVVHGEGVFVLGKPCVSLLPSGRVVGDQAGSALVVPLFGCLLRDRDALGNAPLVYADRRTQTSFLMRVLYTLGRAEIGAARLAVRVPGGGVGAVELQLPATKLAGCKEEWKQPTGDVLPVTVVVAEEGVYIGGPRAVLTPVDGGPGPTIPVARDGHYDTQALATFFEKIKKHFKAITIVVSPAPRLAWAEWAGVLATSAAASGEVLVGASVTRSSEKTDKALVRVITSRPSPPLGEPEPDLSPGPAMRDAAGISLDRKE